MAIQGHPRSLISVLIKNVYATNNSPILPRFWYSKFYSKNTAIPCKIWGCSNCWSWAFKGLSLPTLGLCPRILALWALAVPPGQIPGYVLMPHVLGLAVATPVSFSSLLIVLNKQIPKFHRTASNNNNNNNNNNIVTWLTSIFIHTQNQQNIENTRYEMVCCISRTIWSLSMQQNSNEGWIDVRLIFTNVAKAIVVKSNKYITWHISSFRKVVDFRILLSANVTIFWRNIINQSFFTI